MAVYATTRVGHKVQPVAPKFACSALVGMVAEFYENYIIDVGLQPCNHAKKVGRGRYSIPKVMVVETEVDDGTVVCLDCFYDRMKAWRDECVQ